MVVQRVTLQQARRFAPNITRETVIRGGQQFVQFGSGREFVVPKSVLKQFVAENIKREGGVIISSGISERFLEKLGRDFRINGKSVSREVFLRKKIEAQARGIQASRIKRPITVQERQLTARLIKQKIGSTDIRPSREFLEKSGIGVPKDFREGDVVRVTIIERQIPKEVEELQLREQLKKIVQKERFEFIPKSIRRKPDEKPSKKIVDLSKKSFIDPRRIPTDTEFQKKIFDKIEKAREKTIKFVEKQVGKIPVLGESEITREGIAGGLVLLPGIILFDIPQTLTDPQRFKRDVSEGGKQLELLTKVALPKTISPVEATKEERSFARNALLSAGIQLIVTGAIGVGAVKAFKIAKTKTGEIITKRTKIPKDKLLKEGLTKRDIKILRGRKVKRISKEIPREIKVTLSEKKIENVIIDQLRKRNIEFKKLSKLDQEFLKGQFKAKLINQPELFLPKSRRVALEQAKRAGEPIRLTEKAKKLRKSRTKKLEKDFIKFLERRARIKPEVFLPRVRRIALQQARKAGKPIRLTKEAIKLREKRLEGLKDEFTKLIKKKARIEPEVFLPKARRIALQKVQTIKTLTKAQKEATKLSRIVDKRKNPTESKINIRPTNQNVENILNNELVKRGLIKGEIPKEQLNKLRKAIGDKLKLQLDIKIPKPTKIQTIALRRIKKLPKKPEKRFIDFGKKARETEKRIEKQIKEGKARVTRDGQVILLDKPKIKQLKKEVVRLDKVIRTKQKQIIRTKKKKRRKTIQEEFEELAPQPTEEGIIYAYEYSEPFAFPGLKSELISKGIAKVDTKLELVKVKTQLQKQLLKPKLIQKQKTVILGQLKQLRTLEKSKLDKRKAILITTLAPKVLDAALEKQRVLEVQKEIVKNKGIQKILTDQKVIQKQIFKEIQLQKELQKFRETQIQKAKLIQKRRIRVLKKKKKKKEILISALRKVQAYELSIRREGRFKKVSKKFSKENAKRRGTKITAMTLATTFRIKKLAKKIKSRNIPFDPGPNYRQFVIRKEKKIPTPNQWIEKRNKRLKKAFVSGETLEIQRARRRAPRKKKKKSNNLFS